MSMCLRQDYSSKCLVYDIRECNLYINNFRCALFRVYRLWLFNIIQKSPIYTLSGQYFVYLKTKKRIFTFTATSSDSQSSCVEPAVAREGSVDTEPVDTTGHRRRISEAQRTVLWESFQRNSYPNREQHKLLAELLNLNEKRIKVCNHNYIGNNSLMGLTTFHITQQFDIVII